MPQTPVFPNLTNHFIKLSRCRPIVRMKFGHFIWHIWIFGSKILHFSHYLWVACIHMHIFVLWAQQTIFITTEWEGIQGVINYIPTTSSHKNSSRKTNMIWYTFFVKEILLIILHIRYIFNKKSFYYNIICYIGC